MAFGDPSTPDLPRFSGAGIKTSLGLTLLPPGSRVAAYVRSTGIQTGDDQFTAKMLVTTLAAGLSKVRAGLGDTVVVLPGHTESVADATMMTGLVAGTRILGVGRGSNMPVFRWTATASQWAVAAADVIFQNLRLRLEGANGVVKAINVTGADVGFYGCDFEVASGASNKATIALEVGTGANRFELIGNIFRGTPTHNVTNGVLIAAVVDQVRIADNEMIFSATAANGVINISVAATSVKVLRNVCENTQTSSSACIAIGNAASTGVIADNYASVQASTSPASNSGIVFAGTATIRCFQNFCADEPRLSGILTPGVVT